MTFINSSRSLLSYLLDTKLWIIFPILACWKSSGVVCLIPFTMNEVSYNFLLRVIEVEIIPTSEIFSFFKNFVVSSTILNTGIFTALRMSSINAWKELQGITKNSAPAFSNFFAASKIKGTQRSSPLPLTITSSSISYGRGTLYIKISGLLTLSSFWHEKINSK